MVWCSCPLPNLPLLTSNPAQWSPPAALIFPSPLPQTLLYDLVFLWLNLPPVFSLCPPLFALLRGPAQAWALKLEKTSLRVPCWLSVVTFDTKNRFKKPPALIHARAILYDSTHRYVIQRLVLSTKQSSTNTRPNWTLEWKQLTLHSSSITVYVSSLWSTLLISLSLALFPSLSLSLFYSHVAPAIKWLHEEF